MIKNIFFILTNRQFRCKIYLSNICSIWSDLSLARTILHIDCNKFYASVECLHRPELRNLPVAVGGSDKSRHGIILTKNEIASKFNLKVGEPLWSARQKCKDLVIVPPNFPLYMRFSEEVQTKMS